MERMRYLPYNCGYVGQSEYVFNPERTSSSVRISKEANGILCSWSISQICRLNPPMYDTQYPWNRRRSDNKSVSYET